MSARRVDKSDPKMVAAIRPLTLPKEWVENQRVSDYEVMLTTMTFMSFMTILSPFPDLTALGLLFSSALIMNLKSPSRRKENKDMNNNAYSSYFMAILMTNFLILQKVRIKEESDIQSSL